MKGWAIPGVGSVLPFAIYACWLLRAIAFMDVMAATLTNFRAFATRLGMPKLLTFETSHGWGYVYFHFGLDTHTHVNPFRKLRASKGKEIDV